MTDDLNISAHGLERLNNLRSDSNAKGLFSSDLSVKEFLLIQQAGFEPLGMVMGTSVYHIGFQMGRWKTNMELDVFSQAMYHARELAMSRMESEAKMLNADGIVGVHLCLTQCRWGEHVIEFSAIGTAVKAQASQTAMSKNSSYQKPFTSALSGQDFWLLLQSGYRPVSMVMGTCVYHIAHRGFMSSLKSAGQNVELTNFTQAYYDARELAMERMQAEALRARAEGIVGVTIKEDSYGWEPHVIEFLSIGTAVTCYDPNKQIANPEIVLTLNN